MPHPRRGPIVSAGEREHMSTFLAAGVKLAAAVWGLARVV